MPSKIVNITLPERLLQEIDRAAEEEQRNRSEFFREAARRYLKGRRATSLTREQREALEGQLRDAGGQKGDRTQERSQWAALALPSLTSIWDNEKDAAYDDWRPDERQA